MSGIQPSGVDDLSLYIELIHKLQAGDYQGALAMPLNNMERLDEAFRGLAQTLQARASWQQKLSAITSRFNAGLLLEEILENVYQDFRQIIPYDRLGLSLIEEGGQMVRAHWAKCDYPVKLIDREYAAPLEGSSLEQILLSGYPRILNDLQAYLEQKPHSESTRLIVQEGIRSSLTCPLIAQGKAVGFLFFSSTQANTYASAHVEIFQHIADQLAVVVERGRLVSELWAQKTTLQAQNQELLRLNDLKNTLLGVAAHDLRTPIGNIQLGISLLMDPANWQSGADRLAFLESLLPTLDRQTSHMIHLLDNLLDISMIEAGKLTLEPKQIELRHFLVQAVEHHRRMALLKGIQVLLVCVPSGRVDADPHRLTQVMDNLISNAVKYSPPGSTVRVSVEANQDEWLFRIQDEGPGISEADHQKLFQHFSRLSARPTGGEKSTGLGLAITRRVVEAHGGQIGVISSPGKGATFWFTLPAHHGAEV